MAKQLKEIEIPFGAKDSELCSCEYTIPEGMEAIIVDNKIIVKKKDSEDEKTCKEITEFFKNYSEHGTWKAISDVTRWIAWLEKQGNNDKLIQELGEYKVKYTQEVLEKCMNKKDDERIRKDLLYFLNAHIGCSIAPAFCTQDIIKWVAWIEKQGKKETELFEAEHGKYYYCIKDYFCGGKKQASKGDVVQALRGLPIMGLKDASEYFLPVNSIKCNSNWSEEDEKHLNSIISDIKTDMGAYSRSQEVIDIYNDDISFLKSLKERIQSQPKQEWNEDDERIYKAIIMALLFDDTKGYLTSLYITPEEANNWIKSIKDRYAWEPSNEQINALNNARHSNPFNVHILDTLFHDLNKLRKE